MRMKYRPLYAVNPSDDTLNLPGSAEAIMSEMSDEILMSMPEDELVGPPVSGAGEDELVGPPTVSVEDAPADWADFVEMWYTLTAQVPEFGIEEYEALPPNLQLELLNLAYGMQMGVVDIVSGEPRAIEIMQLGVNGGPIAVEGEDVESVVVTTPSLGNREDAEIVTEIALEDAFPNVPVNDPAMHDIYEVILNCVLTFPSMGVPAITHEEILRSIKLFKIATFPTYEPEELVEFIYNVAMGNYELLAAEMNAVIKDDSRSDALCSQRNRDLVLGAFGEEAAKKFDDFCNAAPDSRIIEIENQGLSLSSVLGVDPAVFDQFVIESFDGATVDALTRDGAALRGAIRDVVRDVAGKAPSKASSEAFKVQGKTLATSEMSTTQKVFTGVALLGTAFGLYKMVHGNRD